MRYILTHLIRGEAREQLQAITKDLVEKFDAFPIHNRIHPHLTLKRPFEFDEEQLKEVCSILNTFTAAHKQSSYQLKSFDHFGTDVIFVDVKASPEMILTIENLRACLKTMKEMPFEEFDDIHFHATVIMRVLKPFDYDQVWSYLSQQKGINLDMKFDNIALMRKESDVWVIDRVWELEA